MFFMFLMFVDVVFLKGSQKLHSNKKSLQKKKSFLFELMPILIPNMLIILIV